MQTRLRHRFESGSARRVVLSLLLAAALVPAAYAERIKDLAQVVGVRDNQLVGYGLVVGLDGTGDQTNQTPFTVQSLKSYLARFGVTVPPNVNPRLKNVAAVSLSAVLPAFSKPGQSIDVTVSAIGNAKSLRGGTLLLSPMKGADSQVYAMAQGNLVVGGVGVATEDGNSVSINIPTVGRIANGATVERPAPTSFGKGDFFYLALHNPDFTTATRMAAAINLALGEGAALAADGATVRVSAPRDPTQRVGFLSVVENVDVEPAEAPARVIVNSRSGTVVIGRHVRVLAAAVAHGNLSVTISNETRVSQPAPFAPEGADTVTVPDSDISVQEEASRMFVFRPGVSLDEIVRAVNRVGATPTDLIAILEALKQAGALRAELVII